MTHNIEFDSDKRFFVVAILALGVTLASGFIVGSINTDGHLPIPLLDTNFTAATGQVTLTPLSWNSVINPGETNQSNDFCASRPAGGDALATVVSATGL